MNRKRAIVTGAFGAAAATAVAVGLLAIPTERWSEWVYGNRFEFAGHEFEGRCVVFVVDRSGSSKDEFEYARKEILSLFTRVHRHFRLGTVFFDSHTMTVPFTGPPLAATKANLRELQDNVRRIRPGSSSCVGRGIARSLQMLRESDVIARTLIYVGDGGGTCGGVNERSHLQQTLEEVAEHDAGDVVIHCVRSPDTGPSQTDFLRQLADMTGGRLLDLPPE